jgi:DNA-directed RNA polymerase subunit F
MIGKNTGETRPVSVPVAFDILEKRKKESELGYEQQLAFEHGEKAALLSREKAEKLEKELVELGVKVKTAIKIVDVMPLNETQLRQVLVIEKRQVEDEDVKKLLEAVSKYREK